MLPEILANTHCPKTQQPYSARRGNQAWEPGVGPGEADQELDQAKLAHEANLGANLDLEVQNVYILFNDATYCINLS